MKIRTRVAVAVIAGGVIAAGVTGAALASPSPSPSTGTGTGTATTHTTAASQAIMGSRSSSTAASQLTWHPLHLINGWKAASPQYYGTPSYAIQNGVLYLSGILAAPQPTVAPEFAVLPAGARPKHFMWLIYYNFGGEGTNLIGNMEIEPSGSMFAYGNAGGGNTLEPSLQAISFPLSS